MFLEVVFPAGAGVAQVRTGARIEECTPGERLHHCVDFAKEALERADRSDLAEHTGPTKAEFVDFLETEVVDRDLTDLF